ncbi:MAG: lysophospholipase [Candidatus Cardinium sp.]|nr:lysophospholipase [Candidatus Cardinium sp.]
MDHSSIPMPMYRRPFFSVVLLHGLGEPIDALSAIAAGMHTAFGNGVLILQPTCRARQRSVYLSTVQQAKKVFFYIKASIKYHQQDYGNFPLIIIGYSHGGVLATILGKYYSAHLNISGIVLINAPLRGVSLLTRSPVEVKAFMSEAKEGLQLVGYKPSWMYTMLIARGIWPLLLACLKPSFYISFPFYGLKDLHPESKCIEEVHDFIYNGAYGIPILLLTSYQDNFGKLFDMYPFIKKHIEAMERLNHAFAQYITGDPLAKHDTLIALSSQLCSNSDRVPIISPYCARTPIKSKIYKDIIHAHNLVAIHPLLFVSCGERIIYAHQVLADIIVFIKDTTEAL